MGRKGSKLIPFLMTALKENKYINLKIENNQSFSLYLPQNTSRLGTECQFVLKDWYKVKNRPYRFKKDYTPAKQGMTADLHKSDFLGLVSKGRKEKLVYRFLTPEEVQVKKMLKKARKSDPYPDSECAPSPESSGYGSGSDHNDEISEGDSHSLLHAFNHDHGYIQDGAKASLIGSLLHNNVENLDFATDHPPAIGNFVQKEDGCIEYVPGSNLNPLPFANIFFDENGRMLKCEPVFVDENFPIVQASADGNLPLLHMGQASVDGNLPVLQIDQAPVSRNLPIMQMDQTSAGENLSSLQTEQASVDGNTQPMHGNFAINPTPVEILESDLRDTIDSLDVDSFMDSFIKNPENSELIDDVMKDLEENLFPDPQECSVKREITSPSGLDIMSYKTKTVKVYECLHRADMPDMIMLTCGPKLKELCVADNKEREPNTPTLIFDEATMKLLSNCTDKKFQFLPNDHLLVFLKCQEAINQNLF